MSCMEKNHFRMTYTPTNFVYRISPADSLSYCNFEKVNKCYLESYDKTNQLDVVNVTPSELKIKASEFWKHKKVDDKTDVKILEKISDWTYSTPYKGTVGNNDKKKDISADISISLGNIVIDKDKSTQLPYLEVTTEDIPVGNLGPSNPILYYNDIILFEDELGDCGLSQSSFRFRVMKDCLFGLLRYYLRVDDVIIRIYDTRFYHEFGKSYILREFSSRESSYEQLKKQGFKFTAEFHMDPKQSDVIYKELELKITLKDKLHFK